MAHFIRSLSSPYMRALGLCACLSVVTACSSAEQDAMEDFLAKYTAEMDSCEKKFNDAKGSARMTQAQTCLQLAFTIEAEWSKNHARHTHDLSERTGSRLRGEKAKLAQRGKSMQDRL